MKHYWLLSLGMMLFFLALFGLVEALGLPLLSEAGPWFDEEGALIAPWLGEGGPVAAGVGIGLLIVDVLLPVPSSLVMLAHGALFGLVGGTLISLVGSIGAGAVAFALGRRGGPLLDRLVPPEERARADRLLAQHGAVALVVSRPLPLIAETVALLAGTSPLSWGRALAAITAGSVPAALLYAATGATAARLDSMALVFGLVVAIAGGFWWWARRITPAP